MRTSVAITLLVAGAAACAAGCAGHNSGVAASPEVDATDYDSTSWIAHLQPQGQYGTITGIFGEVDVKPGTKPGSSQAEVSIVGAPAGTQLPWIIRSGRCGDADARDLGLVSSYRWIDVRGDGTGSLKVQLPSLVLQGESHVEIKTSVGRGGVVACGNFAPVM